MTSCGSRWSRRRTAKSHGSYHAISGGWIAEGLLDLTGCPTETIRLDASGFKSEEAWSKLLSYAAAKFPMGCATQGDPSHREVGLVGNHAYSVMEVRGTVRRSGGAADEADVIRREGRGRGRQRGVGAADSSSVAPNQEPVGTERVER